MIYVKDGKKLKTLKEIAIDYKLPYSLVSARHGRGIRSIEELTKEKNYEMIRK